MFYCCYCQWTWGRSSLGAGRGCFIPQPRFWSWLKQSNTSCEHSLFLSMGHYLEFSSFICNTVFLLRSLRMWWSKNHHVNYKAVATGAWTMWPDCPVAVSLLPKCSIMSICTQGSFGITSDLSVWPHMAKYAATSGVIGQKERMWHSVVSESWWWGFQ